MTEIDKLGPQSITHECRPQDAIKPPKGGKLRLLDPLYYPDYTVDPNGRKSFLSPQVGCG